MVVEKSDRRPSVVQTLRLRAGALVWCVLSTGLVVTGLIAWHDMVTARARAAAAAQVASGSIALLDDLLNAESGQRGFLLTGSLDDLQPYETAVPAVWVDLGRLEAVSGSVPGATDALVPVRRLVEAELSVLAQTVLLARSGRQDQALAIVKANAGGAETSELHGRIAAVRMSARSVYYSRTAEASRAQAVVSAALAVLVVWVAAGVVLAGRTRVRRQRESAQLDALTALQKSLLPREIAGTDGVQLAVRYRSAGGARALIGGDWYDTIRLPAGGLALVIGDVEGHDMTAATVMGLVRGAVRSSALEGHPPAVVVERVNQFLFSSGIERLVTMAYLQLHADDRMATVVLAGHPAPLLLGPQGRPTRPLDVPPGLMLNVDPQARWDERTLLLPNESTLVLYTDGLVEPSARTRDLSAEQVVNATAAQADGPVDLLADALMSAAPRDDDVAVLVAAVCAPHGPSARRAFPTMPLSAAIARLWIADLFAAWQDSGMLARNCAIDDRREAAQLLITELVSNAVRHSDQPVVVTVDMTAEGLTVGVLDSSERMPVMRDAEMAVTEGRGLRLVNALSRKWGVDLLDQGKVVWFEIGFADDPDQEIDEDALLAAFLDGEKDTDPVQQPSDIP